MAAAARPPDWAPGRNSPRKYKYRCAIACCRFLSAFIDTANSDTITCSSGTMVWRLRRRDDTTSWALDCLHSTPELAAWATAQRRQRRWLKAALVLTTCLAAASAGGWASAALRCRGDSSMPSSGSVLPASDSTMTARAVGADMASIGAPPRPGLMSHASVTGAAAATASSACAAEAAALRRRLAAAAAERDAAQAAAETTRRDVAAAVQQLRKSEADHGAQHAAWTQERGVMQQAHNSLRQACPAWRNHRQPSHAASISEPCDCDLAQQTAAGTATQPPCSLAALASGMRNGRWRGLGAAAWAALLQTAVREDSCSADGGRCTGLGSSSASSVLLCGHARWSHAAHLQHPKHMGLSCLTSDKASCMMCGGSFDRPIALTINVQALAVLAAWHLLGSATTMGQRPAAVAAADIGTAALAVPTELLEEDQAAGNDGTTALQLLPLLPAGSDNAADAEKRAEGGQAAHAGDGAVDETLLNDAMVSVLLHDVAICTESRARHTDGQMHCMSSLRCASTLC